MRVDALVRDGGTVEAEKPVRTAADHREESREEDRRYSWIENHLARLDGREARGEYYAWLGR